LLVVAEQKLLVTQIPYKKRTDLPEAARQKCPTTSAAKFYKRD